MATVARSGEGRSFRSYVLASPRAGGLVGGLLGFLVSLDPTLWPRGWIIQAGSIAIVTAVGYGIGSAIGAGIRRLWRLIGLPLLSDKARGWVTVGAAVVVAVVAVVGWQLRQVELREVVGLPVVSVLDIVGLLGVAAILTLVLVLSGRAFAWGVGRFDGLLCRRLPAWGAHVFTGTVVLGVVVLGSAGYYLLNRDIVQGPNLSATPKELSLTASFPLAGGWSQTQLEEALQWADEAGATAAVILDGGHVVAEWGDTSLVSDVHSVRKSIVSVLYGIAIEGRLIDPSATLAQLGIDDIPPLTELERQATIQHIITAKSGIYHPSVMDDDVAGRPERGSHQPGEYFYYNNWSFNAAGGIFQELTGISIGEAFAEWVAQPIGLQDFHQDDVTYASSPESRFPAYRFLMSTRDLARFGLLIQQDGQWDGQQIVSAAWITESTTPHSTVRDQIGYAHMWWTDGPAFFATGTGGQRIYVDPQSNLVIAMKVNTGQGLGTRGLWYFLGPRIRYTQFTDFVALIDAAGPQ